MKNKISVGILAQVDAGKTTLCESMLFLTDVIRKKGRVDNGDTYFDYNASEIQHGITVYSKEASIEWKDQIINIIDTPGHRDFKSEADRVLPIIDVLLFVVSSAEITKPQNVYLFQQLGKIRKPIVVFTSKMDMQRVTVSEAASALTDLYSEKCVLYADGHLQCEAAATIDDVFFNAYLEGSPVSDTYTNKSIMNGNVYPVIFGSGLNGEGVKELLTLLAGLAREVDEQVETDINRAFIFKIDRDIRGVRQIHVKIISGKFKVKDEIIFSAEDKVISEKINEIRQISGARFVNKASVSAGDIAVFTGLSHGTVGESIDTGFNYAHNVSCSQNHIEYTISCPETINKTLFINAIKQLQEEDPSLAFSYSDSNYGSISVHLSGELQKDILCDTFQRRFHIPVSFGDSHVEYLETIAQKVYGNGHYEPLRHYAEVRVELTPLPSGSGIIIDSKCPDNVLSCDWQNVILNCLRTVRIRGVLTGAPITDIKISLLTGKYHIKHTEGGDFREAAIRAVRQALMKADSILLEPHASFTINCKPSLSGRLISELEIAKLKIEKQAVNGSFLFQIDGTGPLITVDSLRKRFLLDFGDTVNFDYSMFGYRSCANVKKIINDTRYNPEADLSQSPDSVFCFHGAGHVVKWNEADAFMQSDPVDYSAVNHNTVYSISEEEFSEILRKNNLLETSAILYTPKKSQSTPEYSLNHLPTLYLIDGSNLLYSFSKKLTGNNNSSQSDQPVLLKEKLVSDLINFLKFTGAGAQLVFDGKSPSAQSADLLQVKDVLCISYSENESADVILERLASSIGPDYNCKMVTSDRLIQVSAFHSGISRISSREFLKEMGEGLDRMRKTIQMNNTGAVHSIGEMTKQ